jgi:hypothetical protein
MSRDPRRPLPVALIKKRTGLTSTKQNTRKDDSRDLHGGDYPVARTRSQRSVLSGERAPLGEAYAGLQELRGG